MLFYICNYLDIKFITIKKYIRNFAINLFFVNFVVSAMYEVLPFVKGSIV